MKQCEIRLESLVKDEQMSTTKIELSCLLKRVMDLPSLLDQKIKNNRRILTSFEKSFAWDCCLSLICSHKLCSCSVPKILTYRNNVWGQNRVLTFLTRYNNEGDWRTKLDSPFDTIITSIFRKQIFKSTMFSKQIMFIAYWDKNGVACWMFSERWKHHSGTLKQHRRLS